MDLRDAEPAEELVLTRTFDAPRAMVWKAFTEAAILAKWWGPKGFEWISGRLELRSGGMHFYGMRAVGGGMEMWGKWVFEEISPMTTLMFLSSFTDPEENTTRSSFSRTFPLQVRNTVTFDEKDGRTTVTLHGEPEEEIRFFTGMMGSMQEGFGNALNQLAEYLRGA